MKRKREAFESKEVEEEEEEEYVVKKNSTVWLDEIPNVSFPPPIKNEPLANQSFLEQARSVNTRKTSDTFDFPAAQTNPELHIKNAVCNLESIEIGSTEIICVKNTNVLDRILQSEGDGSNDLMVEELLNETKLNNADVGQFCDAAILLKIYGYYTALVQLKRIRHPRIDKPLSDGGTDCANDGDAKSLAPRNKRQKKGKGKKLAETNESSSSENVREQQHTLHRDYKVRCISIFPPRMLVEDQQLNNDYTVLSGLRTMHHTVRSNYFLGLFGVDVKISTLNRRKVLVTPKPCKQRPSAECLIYDIQEAKDFVHLFPCAQQPPEDVWLELMKIHSNKHSERMEKSGCHKDDKVVALHQVPKEIMHEITDYLWPKNPAFFSCEMINNCYAHPGDKQVFEKNVGGKGKAKQTILIKPFKKKTDSSGAATVEGGAVS